MRQVRFGRTNRNVSAVSLGTWGHGGPRISGGRAVGWSGNVDQDAAKALLRAHELGINHWDTADVYGDGHAEQLIGGVWDRVPREDIFLATKVGWDAGPYPHYYHPHQIRRQMDQSLRNLRTDSVDLYYLHHCDFGPNDQYLDDAVALLRQFRDQGKIRFIGLSDWDCAAVRRVIERVDPDAVQPYRNLLDDEYASSGLQKWVENHDLGVAFFSPIKHGLLLGKYREPQQFPEGDFRGTIPEFADRHALDRLRRNAEAIRQRFAVHTEPVLHAVLGALLSDSRNACVLLGQRTVRQVEAAAAVGDQLSEDELRWVLDLYRS
jgi:aryl-alcohol dehydrogenase-like predicted oxidoreductase